MQAYPKQLFDHWTKSENPFHCPHCKLQEHTLDIAKLKKAIEFLTKSVSAVNGTSDKPIQSPDNQNTVPKNNVTVASDEPKSSSAKQHYNENSAL